MRASYSTLLLVASTAIASPTPRPQGQGTGADSCPSDPLSIDTWTKLSIDEVLTNLTGRNVQDLASTVGAPNFFCGLDSFCNAGQPCLPIQLPDWYVMVAIQNWNNYMNSLNTAITFASSIISLKLPEIVKDIFPDPVDNVTPLKTLGNIFGQVLGFIPFTGPVATGVLGVQQGLSFVLGRVQPPAPVDKFLAWSNVASSVGDVVTEYQSIISKALGTILDSPIDDPNNGILSVIKGGTFLGVSRNVTENDISGAAVDSITKSAISLALQAQKVFILQTSGSDRDCADSNERSAANFCHQTDDGKFTDATLIRADDQDNAVPQSDTAQLLLDKYGFTKETLLKNPSECLKKNSGKQLVTPFDQGIVNQADDVCAFSILVCDLPVPLPLLNDGFVSLCRGQGLDV